ncbi:hypothetical protein SCLCIDRAFT_1223581 [Scleroderma citrinum Foug A]|uniref:Uncharacterized protein n=1 Tax=Scleroderma citrinum Foug A TaxID=1036808 RepID=A0A0C3D8D3_9AGAM|nr:hypothetical protein SCLCIDRAFT_1223581 [Scleroderma citrinum Foug A]
MRLSAQPAKLLRLKEHSHENLRQIYKETTSLVRRRISKHNSRFRLKYRANIS